MKFKDKNAKVLSIWWFFVLAVIGGGVVLGVLIYNSVEIEVKQIESDILAERILDCVLDEGFLREDFKTFDVFSECGIDKEFFKKGGHFYFKIKVNRQEGDLIREEIVEGDFSLEKDCEIQETLKREQKHFPRCVRKKQYVFYSDNHEIKKGEIEVLAVSNQKGKKVAFI